MATYPLKNIVIGGNTYQIAGGGGGDIFWEIFWENASAGPSEFNHTQIPVNDLAALGYDKDGQIVSTSMSDLIAACLNTDVSASCGFRILPDLSVYSNDIDTWFALKSIYQNQGNDFVCTFEQAVGSTGVNQIVLTVDYSGATLVSCYGEKVTISVNPKELSVTDSYGNAITPSQFMNGGTVKLYDGEIHAAVSETELLGDFNGGEVIIHVGGEYDFNKMHFKLDGYNAGNTNATYGWIVNNGSKKLALFSYSDNRTWNLQIIN